MALSHILDKILGDAETQAAEIRDRGREEARKVLAEAEREAETLHADLMAREEARLKREMENELSAERLAAQRDVLSLKRELLDGLFGQVPELLYHRSAGEYAGILASFVDGEALLLSGELEAGTADVERFGEGFASLVVETLSREFPGCRAAPSRRPGPHGQGVVIRTGKVAHDFSLDSLLAEVQPRIEGRIAAILFSP